MRDDKANVGWRMDSVFCTGMFTDLVKGGAGMTLRAPERPVEQPVGLRLPYGHTAPTVKRLTAAVEEARRFAVEECIVNLERMLEHGH